MKNLRAIRMAKGLTQAEVARELNISRQAYYNYETGKREADYETLLRLGELLGVSVEDLIRNDPNVLENQNQEEAEKKETLSGKEAKKRLDRIIQKRDLSELIELEAIANQLPQEDVEELIRHANLLLLKVKVQSQSKEK